MVPLGTVFEKVARVVRQVARDHAKDKARQKPVASVEVTAHAVLAK